MDSETKAPAQRPPPPWWVPTWSRARFVVPCLLVAAAIIWWFSGGRWRLFPKKFHTVHNELIFRSGQIHPALIEDTIKEHGIKRVVDLAVDEDDDEEDVAENEILKRLGIENIEIPGLDGSGNGPHENYVRAVREMVRAVEEKTPLLVHCAAGTQRTGGAVGLYRMYLEGWTGEAAYAEYLSVRGKADSFRLMNYLNKNMAAIVAGLVREGVLKEAPSPLPWFGPAGSEGKTMSRD